MKILVLNAGSSSNKTRLYEIGDMLPAVAPTPLWQADADWTKEQGKATLKISTATGKKSEQEVSVDSRLQVIEEMLKTMWSGPTQVVAGPHEIVLVGHRVAHGGAAYHESVRITPQVKETIRKFSQFAPLHNPVNLEGIEAIEKVLGDVPQVAAFDTSFHKTLLKEALVYPGPYEWYEQGIRRYGFHGISHEYCMERIGQIVGRDVRTLRIINCHLGNGCSLAAIRNGQSIDTTMGFTPLEGMMMGARSGTIDPGILIYLQREKGYTADRFDQVLNKESGLKGISGISNDIRHVQKAIDEGNERARLALDIYIYRLRYFIGAMLATLGGVDVLSFTGGVGENVPSIRAGACAAFGFLNLAIDEQKNAQSPADEDIATAASAVRVVIVHTEEDWQIAKDCWKLALHQ